ncbi:nitrite reductase small subunit NirD [Mycolicibacterium obuense]|uniref:Nitrite reductase (NADH) small subunit n=1 Tax=Mycolicibacterium obuense TaxID=1807 RepID=A0A0J6WJ65_9MYCO|nr:nitrite reductase small subunit NirD [Mycolicibacterium obuense]KMO82013.1 Nitrite reductase (NADH) small subunit [Mycolicibacterium obuense]
MTILNDIGRVGVWTTACPYDVLLPNRGVGVLLPDGAQAALFRLDDGSVHAVGNIDPFTGAAVMSRGIVGDRGGRATVQSPLKKQAFALDDGVCLDDPTYELPVYATRITPAGDVEVGSPPAEYHSGLLTGRNRSPE